MELVIFGLVAAAAAYSWLHGDESWKIVAEDLDLTYSNPLMAGQKLRGRRRGFDVQIERHPESKQGKKLLIRIRDVDAGFTLGRDSALLRMVKPDIETGDSLFDQRTRIEGDPEWALALLDDEVRRLTDILVSGWNGQLKGNILSAAYSDLEQTATMLDSLLDLAQRLDRPASHELPKRLVERACHDPSNPVRLKAFRLLASPYEFRKEALAAAEILFDAPVASLRLEACKLLVKSSSEKGDAAAKELAVFATGHWNDSSVRRSALDTLVESRYRHTAIPALRTILEQPDAPSVVRTVALDGLIRAGATTELIEIRTEGDAEAEILARGLGRFDASVQPRLLDLLHDSAERVRIAAVRSLGRVGDLDAIRALRQVAGNDRLVKSALTREAELAIADIKDRSSGAQHGEISIVQVAPLEGAVSPSDDSEAGGEVSLTP